jgi:ABC-type transport system involved in multi-copper enzyme maturation permease subunit
VNQERRLRQFGAVFLLELRRLARSRDGLGAVLFASIPLVLTSLVVFVRKEAIAPGQVEHDFAILFQSLVLQVTVFMGCLFAFGSLIRGEQIGKTLHFVFLAPVKREVIVLGKYFAALAATSVVFGIFTALSYLVLLWGQGQSAALSILSSGGALRLVTYALVAVLACASYGAVFLVLGQWAKNPILPAIALWGWEHINFVLPEVLKRLGLIHYLLSLSPVSVPEGFLAVIGDPVPVWVAIPAPLLLAAALLVFAAWKARRTEVDYGVE